MSKKPSLAHLGNSILVVTMLTCPFLDQIALLHSIERWKKLITCHKYLLIACFENNQFCNFLSLLFKTNKTGQDPQSMGCTSIHLGPNYHFSSVQLQNSTQLVCVKTCKLLCLGDCCEHIASNSSLCTSVLFTSATKSEGHMVVSLIE